MHLHCLEQMVYVQLLKGGWKLHVAELQRISHLLISTDRSHRGRNGAAEPAPHGQNIHGTKGDPKHRRDSELFLVWQLCQGQLQYLEGLSRGVGTPFHCSGQIQLVSKGKNRMTCLREAETPSPTEIKAQFGPAGG